MLINRARRLIVIVVTAVFLWPWLLPGLAPVAMAQAVVANSVTPSALTERGAWSAATNYVLDDIVTAHGSSWRAIKSSRNKVPGQTNPSSAAYWEPFAVGINPLGAWLGSTKYQPNDVVTYQGSTWRAKITSLNKIPGIGANYWEQLAAKGAAGAAGPQGAPGVIDLTCQEGQTLKIVSGQWACAAAVTLVSTLMTQPVSGDLQLMASSGCSAGSSLVAVGIVADSTHSIDLTTLDPAAGPGSSFVYNLGQSAQCLLSFATAGAVANFAGHVYCVASCG